MDIMGYSMAGEETVVAVPQLNVCFDIGKAPDQTISIPNILLTHGHMDHSAGIAYYLSHRHFDGQSPGTVLAPANLLPYIKQILTAWGKLDGNHIPAALIGVEPGDEFQIKPNLFASVFATDHCKGSVGYSIIERRKKLKPEYKSLTGAQLVELKKQGIDIENQVDIPLVTYLGDTRCAKFVDLEYVAQSKILITECTFYEQDHIERAQAGKHIHVNDLARLIEQLNNEYIVITHTTQRTSMRQIKRTLEKKLSTDTLKKVYLLMDKRQKPNNQ